LELRNIGEVLCIGRLRCFGHERIGVCWVNRYKSVTVEGWIPRAKPRKTLGEVLYNDVRVKRQKGSCH